MVQLQYCLLGLTYKSFQYFLPNYSEPMKACLEVGKEKKKDYLHAMVFVSFLLFFGKNDKRKTLGVSLSLCLHLVGFFLLMSQ